MKPKQNFIEEIQKPHIGYLLTVLPYVLDELKQIYSEKFEEAYPLSKIWNSEQWLSIFPLDELSSPITEQGLREGIANLDLIIYKNKTDLWGSRH